jgi:hypothetical protein
MNDSSAIWCELSVDPERISVIRNWCHIDDPPSLALSSRTEMRRQLGWRDDVTVLLHAGNMGASKPFRTLWRLPESLINATNWCSSC